MRERTVLRYSECFKQQVIADLESGRVESIALARERYGIRGRATVQKWLRRYGKNHLLAKVVRVEKPDEMDQVRQLRRQVAQLQQALGQTQAENVLNGEFLKLACAQLGQDVAAFGNRRGKGAQDRRPIWTHLVASMITRAG